MLPEYHKHLANKFGGYGLNNDGKTSCVDCDKRMDMPKRTRHVFRSYDECAHVWASQTLGYGSVYSMYFAGRSIWSYGSHFEIARFISPKEVMFTRRTYSNTTSVHKWAVRDAVKHLDVYKLLSFDDMDVNAKDFIDRITSLVGAIKRGRSSLISRVGYLRGIKVDAVNFLDRFGKHVSVVNKKALRKLIATEFFTAQDIKAFKKREKRNDVAQAQARITKRQNEAIRDEQQRAQWALDEIQRNERSRIQSENEAHHLALVDNVEEVWESEITDGNRTAWLHGDDRGEVPYGETLLRVKNNEIETSHGAFVPVSAAVELWDRLKSKQSIKDFTIGHYTVSGIHDNQLVIGCHRIPVREVARMAKVLNLTTQLEVI